MNRSVDYDSGKIIMLNQTLLPRREEYVVISDVAGVAAAISDMVVRGAPAIGAAGALGIAVAARSCQSPDIDQLLKELRQAKEQLDATRPTAVNLSWGTQRMLDRAVETAGRSNERQHIISELDKLALEMLEEDEQINRSLGEHGSELIADNSGVLTHCNAGALACVGFGTALGVIRAAVMSGKTIKVYADETRPRLQGMKLTCYELMRDGIDVTLISDNMAGSLMKSGAIQSVVVGADRIAANGDTANKIGTYSVAVLARYHNIPFYVAAPLSTIDSSIKSGDSIPIEERCAEELTHIDGIRIAPEGVQTYNPSFDVTPAELISGIITEKGIAYPPYNFE